MLQNNDYWWTFASPTSGQVTHRFMNSSHLRRVQCCPKASVMAAHGVSVTAGFCRLCVWCQRGTDTPPKRSRNNHCCLMLFCRHVCLWPCREKFLANQNEGVGWTWTSCHCMSRKPPTSAGVGWTWCDPPVQRKVGRSGPLWLRTDRFWQTWWEVGKTGLCRLGNQRLVG